MDYQIMIRDNGLVNGSKMFSVFNVASGEKIITNKKLEEISEKIVSMYPGLSKKIKQHLQDWSDLPKEVDLSRLDGGDQIKLIEKISEEFEKSLKK